MEHKSRKMIGPVGVCGLQKVVREARGEGGLGVHGFGGHEGNKGIEGTGKKVKQGINTLVACRACQVYWKESEGFPACQVVVIHDGREFHSSPYPSHICHLRGGMERGNADLSQCSNACAFPSHGNSIPTIPPPSPTPPLSHPPLPRRASFTPPTPPASSPTALSSKPCNSRTAPSPPKTRTRVAAVGRGVNSYSSDRS